MPISASLITDPRTNCASLVLTDPLEADGYDSDLTLAEHLVHDEGKPTFWALDVLAAHGRL